MKFLVDLLFIILFCFFSSFVYLLVGFSLYFISHLFLSARLEQFAVKFIAFADAPFFGAHRFWIARHCSSHNCEKCKLWTCAGKEYL